LPVREHAQETTTAAEKEYLSRKRKEFSQEQKRKEKEKRLRIINREKKRAVKRIHLKRLASLFSDCTAVCIYCRIGICYQQATIPSA
jgi:uncharacterized protein YbcI